MLMLTKSYSCKFHTLCLVKTILHSNMIIRTTRKNYAPYVFSIFPSTNAK